MADSQRLWSVCCVVGPTASGKTAVALELARRLGGEVLTVDSMQVYRGMDIGTAKPTRDERRGVTHHGIDLVDPTERFSVARFVEHADAVIAQARTQNVPLIAAGGTPMYFKAVFEGLFDGPGGNPELRARLSSLGPAVLHARLLEVDPQSAARIHRNDTKRLIRALEVFELTGQPISGRQVEWSSGRERHRTVWFGLDWPREALNRRINQRCRAMLEAGWVDEVRRLTDRFGTDWPTAIDAAGYAQLVAHLEGRLSLPDAFEQIKIHTRQLARRQEKWFRRFERVTWLDGHQSPSQVVGQILERWSLISDEARPRD